MRQVFRYVTIIGIYVYLHVCMHSLSQDTVEALNTASSATWDVDTGSLAPLTACEPVSPTYNVEAKPVPLLPRPKTLQVQHCIRGAGAADVMS